MYFGALRLLLLLILTGILFLALKVDEISNLKYAMILQSGSAFWHWSVTKYSQF